MAVRFGCATAWAPMLPPAPGRFSTMTVLPYLFSSRRAIARASTSAIPPAENGTTIVIGQLGKDSCASGRGGSPNGWDPWPRPFRPELQGALPRPSRPQYEIGERVTCWPTRKSSGMWEAFTAGDKQKFFAAMADDIRFTMMGTTSLSLVTHRKQEMADKILRPLAAALD